MRFIELIIEKIVFVKYKFQKTARDKDDENETHFIIFKLHIMTYYVIFIRLYNNVQSFDTVYDKTAHKFLLKIFLS